MLSSVNDFGISNISVDMLSRNSNFWKVIFAETVGKIGMSIFTGNPPGSFKVTNSRSLVKCLKGAITSNTFSNISTVKGKSLLYIQRCKIKKIELDLKKIPFQGLWIRIYLFSGALFRLPLPLLHETFYLFPCILIVFQALDILQALHLYIPPKIHYSLLEALVIHVAQSNKWDKIWISFKSMFGNVYCVYSVYYTPYSPFSGPRQVDNYYLSGQKQVAWTSVSYNA